MSSDFNRKDRVADALQCELAQIIRQQVRDPRVGMVSVNAVDITKDLSSAKVYVTFVDEKQGCNVSERVAILNKAAGFLRTHVGKEIRLRVVPQLRFIFDETVYKAQEISDLIATARARDEALKN